MSKPVQLLIRSTVSVALPPEFEQAPHLPDLLNAALLEQCVDETSTIGPWIIFKPGVTDNYASMTVRRVLAKAESDILYNCCTGGVAPNWKAYRGLVLGGCVKDEEDYTIGSIPRDDAEFFTVYGRDHDGLCEAITDSHSLEHGQAVGNWLARLSGLPLVVEC